jgi:hypothetical protein
LPGNPYDPNQDPILQQILQQGTPQLTYHTVSGGPNSPEWSVHFELSSPSDIGGYIAQNINEVNVFGEQVYNYTEFWQVDPDSQFTVYWGDIPADDTFSGGPMGDVVDANAAFYQGMQLPPGTFSSGSCDPATKAAESLPAIPGDYAPPIMNPTVPVTRTWTIP